MREVIEKGDTLEITEKPKAIIRIAMVLFSLLPSVILVRIYLQQGFIDSVDAGLILLVLPGVWALFYKKQTRINRLTKELNVRYKLLIEYYSWRHSLDNYVEVQVFDELHVAEDQRGSTRHHVIALSPTPAINNKLVENECLRLIVTSYKIEQIKSLAKKIGGALNIPVRDYRGTTRGHR
ncbi:MAG: hypothetical protein GXP10_05250 [Gammaproteobacteria bacterium]|nr:hypothetical protein [Gammaproteobacteria bacterium]